MWMYERKLMYPVKIKNPNPRLAQIVISQYGGPDGELGASLRYLSQRFWMPTSETQGILNDIGISCLKCCRKVLLLRKRHFPPARKRVQIYIHFISAVNCNFINQIFEEYTVCFNSV